uniref:Protein kinase domain-containing protein n=1 Tax=Pristionchus pacificus TaxID=54126 RepID=A0A2A6CWM6_PRIPA|eukprot:PDM82486.1 protein kinase [Pristionchus pacificus]
MLPNEGFGTVFEARNLLDGQMYAVKRIPTDESYVNKALVEAKAAALLRHEGIVRYFTAWIEKPPTRWQYYNWFAKDSAFLYIKMEPTNILFGKDGLLKIADLAKVDMFALGLILAELCVVMTDDEAAKVRQ